MYVAFTLGAHCDLFCLTGIRLGCCLFVSIRFARARRISCMIARLSSRLIVQTSVDVRDLFADVADGAWTKRCVAYIF